MYSWSLNVWQLQPFGASHIMLDGNPVYTYKVFKLLMESNVELANDWTWLSYRDLSKTKQRQAQHVDRNITIWATVVITKDVCMRPCVNRCLEGPNKELNIWHFKKWLFSENQEDIPSFNYHSFKDSPSPRAFVSSLCTMISCLHLTIFLEQKLEV